MSRQVQRREKWTKDELFHVAEVLIGISLVCALLGFWDPNLFRLAGIVQGAVVIVLLRGYRR